MSPNMLALTVAVQQVTASPWPALPLQTLVVNTPQPCVPAGGGLNCTFTVKAYVGKNVFTFNEYATKNPKPQDTPLGTLTTGAEKVTSGGSGLNFTLDGVVNQIELSVPNPNSNFDPASKNDRGKTDRYGHDVPALRQLEDASGASIATDTFSSPVTIQVSLANSAFRSRWPRTVLAIPRHRRSSR